MRLNLNVRLPAALLAGLIITGCACTNDTPVSVAAAEAEAASAHVCTEPRSPICTKEYAPACGKHFDGSSKTYPNGCVACADPDVESHTFGACDE